ncbi:hypothetical protein TcBrA4_0051320 [Trypanosoma cruzi]|nr:hypothetical protein TcBrA4_0051320 [Trypanosoma cruzi]
MRLADSRGRLLWSWRRATSRQCGCAGAESSPPAMPQETQEEYRRKVPLGQSEASAAQIADVIAFLVSKDAGYITGTTLKVDGGLSLARA